VDEAGFGTKRTKTMRATSVDAARDLALRFCEEFNLNLIDVVVA
jgi:hypothetical protein